MLCKILSKTSFNLDTETVEVTNYRSTVLFTTNRPMTPEEVIRHKFNLLRTDLEDLYSDANYDINYSISSISHHYEFIKSK